HPAARRIAAQAHSDLLVLERTINEKTGKLRQDIQVDDVRRTAAFFGSTPGEGGWRGGIVDAVDELNEAGANELLQMPEKAPRRATIGEPIGGARSADNALPLPITGVAAARGRGRGAGRGRCDRGAARCFRDRGRKRSCGRKRRPRAGASRS